MHKIWNELHIEVPIIQAGMAGGITTPELVAEVANNGGLGTIGAGYMSDADLKEAIQQTKALTDKPFAVNVFTDNLEAFSSEVGDMQQFLNRYRQELELEPGERSIKVNDYLQEKIYCIINENIPIVSTAFGVLSSMLIERLKENDITLMGMATNVHEAKQLEEAGYDMVVVQGYEAGGHRGTFQLQSYPDGCNIGLMVLLQDVLESVFIPVVAAGGIYHHDQIEGILKMGACGVQLGTRFLVAEEAGTNKAYKQALIKAKTEDTIITKVISGRPARGITNRLVRELTENDIPLLPFPIQNECTKDIRGAAKEYAHSELQSLWAGQGVSHITKEESVKDIFDSLTAN
ncbi:MAG TPA: nitronate monooxygenase [Virgibacillus sp.]|nr:nitronate monooxygenase [Virgibacillus sp.]